MDTFSRYRDFVVTSFVREVEPLAVERGEGTEILDADGRRYIDCFAGIAVTNCGHGNRVILDAAAAQLEKLVHCASYIYHSPPTAALAERIAGVVPGRLQKSFFGSSGAEAVEGALRLARRHTGRREFIALQASFHGRTYAALSLSGLSRRKGGGGPYMPGVAFAPVPYCYRCPLGLKPESCGLRCADAVEDTIRFSTSDDVAAFIVEPVLGEGGIIVPPAGYFARVAEVLSNHGILLIVDEVQTGFGRTGCMFAVERTGVEPDIMVLGKGIANGFPLSAFVTRAEIAGAFQPGDHLSTFGGNPVSCAASLATIDFMEREHLPEKAEALGRWLIGRLSDLREEFACVGEVRGQGLMIGVELVADAGHDDRTPVPELAAAVRASCRENGVLIGVGGVFGNVLRFQPPLVIGGDELAQVVDVVRDAIRRCLGGS